MAWGIGARRAVLLAALLSTTCIAGLAAGQDAGAGSEATPGLAQAQRPVDFDIPAQPLSSALTAFGTQSGYQVSVDQGALANQRSTAVSGRLTPDEALRRMLMGTSLTGRFPGGRSVFLTKAPETGPGAVALEPVRVQANAPPPQAEIGNLPPPYAGGQVARGGRVGVLGNRDYMDTPFSTTVYTERTIQNQQALTLLDVIAVDPTIRAIYPQGSNGDRLVMRGFQVLPRDMAFNGLYGVSPDTTVGMAGIERVEVFRGPTAMLNGMAPNGAIGGTFNFVPKRAPDEGITQATARYLSSSQFGGQLDVGRRFGPDEVLGVRANVAFTGGNTPVAYNVDNLLEVTVGADYRGVDTRLDADFGYQKRRVDGLRLGTFLAAGVGVPPPPNAKNNFNQPWEYIVYDDLYGMLRFEHDFTRDLTGYIKVGGRSTNRNVLSTFATILNQQGATTNSAALQTLGFLQTVSADVGGRGRFETGPIRHEAAANVTYQKELNGFRNTSGFNPAFSNNIYAPFVVAAPNVPAAALTPPAQTSETLLTSIGFMDALSVANDRIQVIAGVRSQRIQLSNFSAITGLTTPATPGSDQSAVTPTVSLVVRPWKELSLYGNYIEALEQGPVAGIGTLNAGQAFPPFVSKQFEFGAKVDFGNFGATLSAFQITRPSSFVNAGVFTVDGQQRNRGLEFLAFGEPLPGFKPLAGFTVLDAVLTSTANGTNNGKTAPGAANFQTNIGFDWDLPAVRGLTLSARVLYTGLAYIDQANTQVAPPWTRVDLGARYTFERPDGKPLTLRANVINVGDTNYWMAANGFINEGLPRTFLLSLTADF